MFEMVAQQLLKKGYTEDLKIKTKCLFHGIRLNQTLCIDKLEIMYTCAAQKNSKEVGNKYMSDAPR